MSNSSASASASASEALVGEYEVFLSFCGQDTRYGFTDFLYTSLCGVGIRTFRDNESLHVGEEIGHELLKAITDSKISIPVFSKNYASSKWCLLELAHMVQCQENGGQMVFPIFYDVDPFDVRHQSGSYEEAFRQHKKRRFDGKVIQGWKDALKKVGQLKGLELKKETSGHEGKLVEIITDKVLNFLKQNNKDEDLNLVGMPSRTEKMEELLNIHSDGVRFIGIHGMGGLGKTTIANVIYKKYQRHFECHSFLKNVREIESRNGIVHLQKKLLSHICKRKNVDVDDYEDGIKKIKDAVCKKKVLIVLDDVDKKSQINRLARSWKWFPAGARIIITTRNEDVLLAPERSHPEVYRSYQPDYLDPRESLELFSKHAFGSKIPPKGYHTLSKAVASTAAGLPLVLKVTGSSLYGETDKELWEEKIEELNKIPPTKVQQKLRLSFDPLTDVQKEMFLDIACLFIGHDKTNPCYMWDDCEFYPKNVLKVLERRSLITVGDDDILRMHDQLRDLGKQIVREGKLNGSGRWSWLLDSDKAFDVYKTAPQETESVKVLCLGRYSVPKEKKSGFAPSRWGYYDPRLVKEKFLALQHLRKQKSFPSWRSSRDPSDLRQTVPLPRRLAGEKFLALQHLRYLTLDARDTLYGDFEHCLSNLRWLQWRYHVHAWESITPTNLHLRNLVILDLSSSYITEDSDLWSQIQMFKKLKVLDLHQCSYLRRIPFLSTFSNLEKLVVNNCYLCSLDGIEELIFLRYLDATCCKSLETLPNLSRLTELKELNVSKCKRIVDIPGLDKLESLEFLYMRSCESLQRLSDVSNLKRLKGLDASGVILTEIRGLGGLKSLEFLDMSYRIRIERVFDLMNLKTLRILNIRCCTKLIEIHGLEGLESLGCLIMNNCESIETLPDLSKLKSLNTLSVQNCEKLTEILGLDELESLEMLLMEGCKSIEMLPGISNLTKLLVLNVAGCEKLTEIPGLEELKSLEYLDICDCKSIENLPDFSNHRKLEEINAAGCEKLTEIRGLENLESFRKLFIYDWEINRYVWTLTTSPMDILKT